MRLRIAVLGGGTGTFTVLSGLKRHPVDLAAIVSMADNGGSTGLLRDELGVLPPGDIRQCLVALAPEGSMLRQLFMYRFHEGKMNGHNLGNLLLAALEKITGDPLQAIEEAHRILRVEGRVIPVTDRAANLYAELEDGTVVEGEHAIDAPEKQSASIAKIFLGSSVSANPEALRAIKIADVVVIGPGDFYTSLIPVLLVDGVTDALAEAKRLVFVLPLASKRWQTFGYPASKYVRILERHLNPARIDLILANSETPPETIVEKYRELGEPLLDEDLGDDPRVRRMPLLPEKITQPASGDPLKRSLLRHDPAKLASALLRLI